jgi:membrane fusion protein (multidrug efflux system)
MMNKVNFMTFQHKQYKPMKTLKISFTLLLLSVLLGCGKDKAEKKAPVVDAVETIQTFSLRKEPIASQISLPAELTGFRQVELFAKVGSYVKTLKVDIGSEVKQGQLLVELEAPEISSQLAAVQSRLRSQEAVYAGSNSTYQRLLETSKVEGTISRNDLELALSRNNSELGQLEAARAALKEIQVMQSYLQIRAPFSGRITARNVNTGAFVGPGTQVPLLVMQDQKKLRLAISVPETYTNYLKQGDELDFSVASLIGKKFKARISRMSGALDARLRSERVELDVINDSNELKPGNIAEVKVPLKSKQDPFVVPKSAVMNTSEGVFVIKAVSNKGHWIPVEIGLETGDKTAIYSDSLRQNDTLVTKASEELREGDVIN